MSGSRHHRLLLIEDDRRTAASVEAYLGHHGYQVEVRHDGPSGLEAALSGRHDLVVLDLMLPGMDGMEICRRLRRESEIPIVMLTARTTTGDRVEGLEAGADDYLPKPFSPRELTARIRAVLRRTDSREVVGPSLHRFGELLLDLSARTVRVKGRPAELTATEFDILAVMARSPGRVFTREALLARVPGSGDPVQDRTVDVHVKNLRRKIEPDRDNPLYIRTVFGVGYRFDGGAGDPAGGDGEEAG